jgi:chromosomal replication initiator protein
MGRPDPQVKSAILAYLRKHHTDMCRHWFEQIEPLDIAGGVLRLVVKEPVQLKYLQRCCTRQFAEAAQAASGRLLAVRFVGEGEALDEPVTTSGSASSSSPRVPAENLVYEEMLLSPDYCFDNFVVGPGNRLAHAAAVAVARKPGGAYNPFFIHGGVGLGKTHLLQAVSQTILQQSPDTHILYISCNGFMDLFFDAVKDGNMADFRHHFRNVDVLVIDDIHFLSKRDQSQEEFFHTFNTLYQSGKQIVLSSDAPPNEIPDLEERLTSRFNCGLVARIDKPCYDTRVAIVKSKASMRGLELPDEIPAYIAAKVDSNIRELEGALTRIQGLAMATGIPICLELAKSALGEELEPAGPEHPTIEVIIEAVTRYFDVKVTDLLSKRRHKSIALPRQVCMYLARRHTRYSLEEIGGYFGGRDHTTVMHAVKTINAKCTSDPSLNRDVSRLEESLAGRLPGRG